MAAIIADPQLHAEAKAVAPALMARASPAGEDAVRRALQPLVLTYGVGDAARSPAFWQPYGKALSGLPVEALAKGIDDYTAAHDSHFFPKPGPLKALCDAHARPIFQAAHRARAAALAQPAKPIENRIQPEAMKRLMEEFSTKSLAGKPSPLVARRGELPSTAGKPDAGGITPEMRALLARQRGDATA